MPSTQKALLIKEPHGPWVLDTVEIEKPGPGLILIKVISASLNPVDWKIQKWNVLIDGYPAVLGSDIAGEVEEVGEGVTDFKKGDRVFTQSEFIKNRGAFQQFVVGHAKYTSKVPAKLSYDDVTTLPMGLTTAYSALYTPAPTGLGATPPPSNGFGKHADTPIFILGGGTSVAQYALQLAKISGFSPIITTASLKHKDALVELGATHVLDRTLSDAEIKKEVAAIAKKPVLHAFDTVSGAATQQLALNVLGENGTTAFVLPADKDLNITEGKKISQAYAGLQAPQNVELLQTLYHDTIYGWLEKGLIVPNRYEVVPGGLNGIADGMARLEADKVSRLKLVARPQETA